MRQPLAVLGVKTVAECVAHYLVLWALPTVLIEFPELRIPR